MGNLCFHRPKNIKFEVKICYKCYNNEFYKYSMLQNDELINLLQCVYRLKHFTEIKYDDNNNIINKENSHPFLKDYWYLFYQYNDKYYIDEYYACQNCYNKSPDIIIKYMEYNSCGWIDEKIIIY